MDNFAMGQNESIWLEPEEDTRKACCTCDECGEDILDGDDMYQIGRRTYCQSCIDDAHCYAESA